MEGVNRNVWSRNVLPTTGRPGVPTSRRWRTSCLAVVLSIGIAECGSASPKDQVRQAWSELKSALVAGDASKFCALLSDQARAQLLVEVAVVSPVSSCEAAAHTDFDIARNARAQIANAKLTSVVVHGDQATTTDTTGPPPNDWIKVLGKWEVASLSSG